MRAMLLTFFSTEFVYFHSLSSGSRRSSEMVLSHAARREVTVVECSSEQPPFWERRIRHGLLRFNDFLPVYSERAHGLFFLNVGHTVDDDDDDVDLRRVHLENVSISRVPCLLAATIISVSQHVTTTTTRRINQSIKMHVPIYLEEMNHG